MIANQKMRLFLLLALAMLLCLGRKSFASEPLVMEETSIRQLRDSVAGLAKGCCMLDMQANPEHIPFYRMIPAGQGEKNAVSMIRYRTLRIQVRTILYTEEDFHLKCLFVYEYNKHAGRIVDRLILDDKLDQAKDFLGFMLRHDTVRFMSQENEKYLKRLNEAIENKKLSSYEDRLDFISKGKRPAYIIQLPPPSEQSEEPEIPEGDDLVLEKLVEFFDTPMNTLLLAADSRVDGSEGSGPALSSELKDNAPPAGAEPPAPKP